MTSRGGLRLAALDPPRQLPGREVQPSPVDSSAPAPPSAIHEPSDGHGADRSAPDTSGTARHQEDCDATAGESPAGAYLTGHPGLPGHLAPGAASTIGQSETATRA